MSRCICSNNTEEVNSENKIDVFIVSDPFSTPLMYNYMNYVHYLQSTVFKKIKNDEKVLPKSLSQSNKAIPYLHGGFLTIIKI